MTLFSEAVENFIGGPLSWFKANLPCYMGGLNLISTVLHAPAAYISSIVESGAFQILHHTPDPLWFLPPAISFLVSSGKMTSWYCLEDIDVHLCQKSFSHSIDKACSFTLVEAAIDVQSNALALSTSLSLQGTGSMLFLQRPESVSVRAPGCHSNFYHATSHSGRCCFQAGFRIKRLPKQGKWPPTMLNVMSFLPIVVETEV